MPDILVHCPHCGHKLNLPEDYLGRLVSCLECQGPFRAPIREEGQLTAPIAMARGRGVPAKLFIPLFGLLVLGVMGIFLNGYLLSNPAAAADYSRNVLAELMTKDPPEKAAWDAADKKAKPTPDELKRREEVAAEFRKTQREMIEKKAADEVPDISKLCYFGLGTSVLTFLGGLAFLTRRGVPVAYLGCLGAALNSPHLGCCLVGIIVAIWGVLALVSDEGRRYFRRSP